MAAGVKNKMFLIMNQTIQNLFPVNSSDWKGGRYSRSYK